MKIYILFQGWKHISNGYPIAAFKSKKSVRDYVAKKFPDMKGTQRFKQNEMYWQSEDCWLKCNDEQIKLIE